MAEDGEEKDEKAYADFKKKMSYIILGAVVLFNIICRFSLLEYRGQKMLAFTFASLRDILERKSFDASIIGTHTLNTEFGEIVLKNSCKVAVSFSKIEAIEKINFIAKRASHNLATGEIRMPKDISVLFHYYNNIDKINIEHQPVFVSGVSLKAGRAFIKPEDYPGTDVLFNGNEVPDRIILQDSTWIDCIPSGEKASWM